jgi:hypothetical protein
MSTEETPVAPLAEPPLLQADAEEADTEGEVVEKESAEDAEPPSTHVRAPLVTQLLLATAATEGDPATSPLRAILGDRELPDFLGSEAFLEAGGDEATAALIEVVGDNNGRDPTVQRAARKVGTYVKQLEQFAAYMTWSKDRIEADSKQVERISKDLRYTRNELLKEREARSTLAQQHESLARSHAKLAEDVQRGAGGRGVHFGDDSDFGPTQQALLQQLDRQVNAAGGDLDLLKCSLETFQSQLESGGGVQCHGVDIGGYRECEAFYKSANINIGAFHDAFAMAHAIKTTVVYEADALRSREARTKVKLINPLEASTVTSFDSPVPSIIAASGKSAHAAMSDHLKSFKDFKGSGRDRGVGQQIKVGCKAIVERISKLRETQGTNAQARALSLGMASDARLFNEGFVRFMEELNEELTADTTYSPQEAWAVCIDCADEIWRELSAVRSAYLDAACMSKGLYLWGMLQAWKVQQRYLANDFKNDPALTGIMVRRLLLHGGDTSVKDKLTKLDSLFTKVEDNNQRVLCQTTEQGNDYSESCVVLFPELSGAGLSARKKDLGASRFGK